MKNQNFRPPESFRPDTTKTLVLVDWTNLMYRAWFASKEQSWVAYCKFFDMMRLCIHKSRQPGVPIGVIFCGESNTILKRTIFFPAYKATRKHSKNEEFVMFRRVLERYIENLGYKMMRVNGAEADDVIASIVASTCCKNCKNPSSYTTDIVIFSGDRDLQQLLAWRRVLIYRAPGLFVDAKTFEEDVGIPVEKYTLYKALVGDKSDNISGVEGFGPVKARTAINANSIPEDIWELGGAKASAEFRLSLQLVKLDTRIDVDLSDIYTGEPKIDSPFSKQVDARIMFEIKRFKEEFN
ncbi:MAG: hypothetical protein PHX43_05280 [Alphaproteobacteria bacterium]|nr:hypothetical protein [Alphaproteobacteria bacterium]